MTVLTIPQLQALLGHVTYRPGWLFLAYQGRHEGPHLQITTVVPDAYNPDETTTLDIHTSIPPMETPAQFYTWVGWRLARIESHEQREFYRIDGVPWDDPHKPNADRDL